MIPVRWLAVLAPLALLATHLTARPDAEGQLEAVMQAQTEPVPAADAHAAVTPDREESLTVEMTAYTSLAAHTDGTPNVTASGAPAGPGTVAVSRDLLRRFPYGSELVVLSVSGEGCGGWTPETPLTVADTMNARLRNHVDVWLGTLEQAQNWGRCRAEVRKP